MDLYSRKIIAWTLSKTLEVDEVLKCLETAKKEGKVQNQSSFMQIAECTIHQKNIKS